MTRVAAVILAGLCAAYVAVCEASDGSVVPFTYGFHGPVRSLYNFNIPFQYDDQRDSYWTTTTGSNAVQVNHDQMIIRKSGLYAFFFSIQRREGGSNVDDTYDLKLLTKNSDRDVTVASARTSGPNQSGSGQMILPLNRGDRIFLQSRHGLEGQVIGSTLTFTANCLYNGPLPERPADQDDDIVRPNRPRPNRPRPERPADYDDDIVRPNNSTIASWINNSTIASWMNSTMARWLLYL